MILNSNINIKLTSNLIMGAVWTCCTGRKELKLLEYMPDKEGDDVIITLNRLKPGI